MASWKIPMFNIGNTYIFIQIVDFPATGLKHWIFFQLHWWNWITMKFPRYIEGLTASCKASEFDVYPAFPGPWRCGFLVFFFSTWMTRLRIFSKESQLKPSCVTSQHPQLGGRSNSWSKGGILGMFLGSSHTFSSVSVAMDVGPGVEKNMSNPCRNEKPKRGPGPQPFKDKGWWLKVAKHMNSTLSFQIPSPSCGKGGEN